MNTREIRINKNIIFEDQYNVGYLVVDNCDIMCNTSPIYYDELPVEWIIATYTLFVLRWALCCIHYHELLRTDKYIHLLFQLSKERYWKLHNSLCGVTIILILSATIVLSYFIPSIDDSFAANSTSNLLSSLAKPLAKATSSLNLAKPSINATRLQQIPNNIATSVEN